MSEDIKGTVVTASRPTRSDSISKLATALAKAQGEIENATKDGKGTYGKYATLASTWEAIRKPLSDNEIAVYQRIIRHGSRQVLATMLLHSSGEFIDDCELELVYDNNNRMTAMQAMGSAVTYARRYTLQAVTGIAPTDDDDGAAAGNPPRDERQSKSTQAQNTQGPKNQTSKPAITPKAESKPKEAPMAGDDDWLRMDEVLMTSGLTQKDFRDWAEAIHGLKQGGGVYQSYINEFIGFAGAEGFSAEDFRKFVADTKSSPKEPKGPPEGDYVMPLGKGTNGKKLSDLTPKTLAEIVVWADAEMKKTPKPKNIGQLFEVRSNIAAYLKAMGVSNG